MWNKRPIWQLASLHGSLLMLVTISCLMMFQLETMNLLLLLPFLDLIQDKSSLLAQNTQNLPIETLEKPWQPYWLWSKLLRQLTNINVEGDSQVVTSTISNSSTSPEWLVYNILTDISSLLKSFQSWTIQNQNQKRCALSQHNGLQQTTCLAAYPLLNYQCVYQTSTL